MVEKKKISGAVRHLGSRNELNGLMELRKNKKFISLLLTTTPLSTKGEWMSYWDMIDGKSYKQNQYPYINQFYILMLPEELLKLKKIIDKKIKQLKLNDTKLEEKAPK